MINLLPEERKQDIRAARTNVILLRYNLFALFATAALAALCALFYIILQLSHSNAISTSNENAAKSLAYINTRKAADEYRNDLSTAKQILDNSFSYTPIIFKITELLPDGVILDAVDLSATSLGQQTKFTAHAKSYAQATKLKTNFQTSDMFSNVYFEQLTDENDVNGSKAYPILIDISAKINGMKK